MKPILIYFITLLISYIATIPPGPLSVFVVHTTLQKNLKIAFWVMLGGVLCETAYAFLAMKGVLIFDKYPQLDYWIHWAIIILLFVVGLITFFQKTEEIKKEKVLINNKLISFFKGVSLSLFNPALIPFWLIVLLEYRKWPWLKMNTILDDLAFVLGAGSGTLLLVFTYAIIANKKRNLIYKYLTDSRLNKVMGIIFIGLAVWQLANFLL